LDNILWSISWSTALIPELQMIPDRTVFLRNPCVSSCASIAEGMEGSLLSNSAVFFEHLLAGATEPIKDKQGTEVGRLGGGDSDAFTICKSKSG
jgi:hypothetical protein